MTISSQTRKAGPFDGDDTTVDFPFSFKVFSAADVLVVQLDEATDTESELTLDSEYSVALNSNQNANPGGTVTLSSALAAGYSLVVTSSIGYLQETDLTNQGGYYPRVITDALDRLTIFAQQLKEEVDRAAKVRITAGQDAGTLVDNINNLAAVLSGITTVATPYQTFSGTGEQTDFTLSSTPTSIGCVEVYVDGLNKIPGTDYTLNADVLTFTSAPDLGTDNVFVRWTVVTATATIEDGSISTAKLAASAVTSAKIAAGAVTTGRIADGAVTSAKLDSAGVTLPAGSLVQVPDPTDDSGAPASTSWVKNLTASDARAGVIEIATAAESKAGSSTVLAVTPGTQKQNVLHPKSIGFINLSTPASPVVAYGERAASCAQNGTGDFTVTLSDTYVTAKLVPQVIPYETSANLRTVKITAVTTTSFRVVFENNASAKANPEGFYFAVFGELAP